MTWCAGARLAPVRPGDGKDRFYSGIDTLWLWPLPPSGPIELVMQWPSLGIGEVRVVLDGDRILDLAQQVVPLWPQE